MILAEAIFTDAPSNIAGWLACVLFVLWIANAGFKFFRNLAGEPPSPPNAQLERAVILLTKTVEDHINQNRQDHRDIFAKMGGIERGARGALEASISASNVSRDNMHNRINQILAALSRVEGKLEK